MKPSETLKSGTNVQKLFDTFICENGINPTVYSIINKQTNSYLEHSQPSIGLA